MSIRYRDQIIGGSEKFISVTKAQYDILVANERLIPGAIYNIIDDVTEDIGQGNGIADENYLPSGTVITVGASDAQFTDLQSAINFLTGKWSSDTVVISLAQDTYTTSDTVAIDCSLFNIPKLCIKGNGATLKVINTTDWAGGILIRHGNVRIENLIIDRNSNKGGNNTRGLTIERPDTTVLAINVTIQNVGQDAAYVAGGAHLNTERTYITMNCSTGIFCSGGFFTASYNTSFTGNNVSTYFQVGGGGYLSFHFARRSFTNVTNQTNVSIGTMQATGCITGIWLN